MPITTPARDQFAVDADGLRRAGATDLTYADGSEAELLELLRSCSSVASTSTEPLSRARTWAERYHTHPARAGVVRGLSIPRDAVVLEVGAGCGGVTRYLGEIADTVDALEPMPARALVARERTRDLPGVAVLVGEIDDLPPVAAYDVVVVVGVLEYVGHGTDDSQPYVDFLRAIATRLKPGGSLVLAIENQFGVKYLAGAPEDHTSQVFDSIEGYPRGERARTFSRRRLLDLFETAGFTARALGAFPDYKLTRAIFDLDAVPERARSLLVDAPTFPSPDWALPRPTLASERRIWQELVSAGLAAETPNSFIVVAGVDGPSPLWPASRIAVHVDEHQHPALARVNDVLATDPVTVSTRALNTAADAPAGYEVIAVDREFIDGRDLSRVLAEADATRRASLLRSYAELVRADSGPGASLSTTAIVRPGDEVRRTPATLRSHELTADEALARGILWLGLDAAASSPPTLWPGATVRGDIVGHFASFVLADAPADWLERTIDREARLQSVLSLDLLGPDAVELWAQRLRDLLATPLTVGQLATRDYDGVRERAGRLAELESAYRASQDLLAEAQREVERLRQQLGIRGG